MSDDKKHEPICILMADDDPADVLLTRKAFQANRLRNPFRSVSSGDELLCYLRREGDYANVDLYPWPGLILLDLNMPGKDGRATLKEIKEDDLLRTIPVVVLTTSKAERDLLETYNLGANSFVTKPVTFSELVGVIRSLTEYWMEIVSLPSTAAT